MANRYAKTKNVDELSDIDLLATQLRAKGTSSPTQRADTLLSEAGSLRSVIYKTRDNENRAPFLSVSESRRIQAGIELGKRALFESVAGKDVLDSPHAVREFLSLQLADREHEIFAVIFLNTRNHVIQFKEVFRGCNDSAACYPREIVKECLACNCANVILAHNHPSSQNSEPSETDIRLTRKLVDALKLVDIGCYDHLVCGGSTVTSLAERGLM